MTSLSEPLVEACALARLIEARAQAIACLSRSISSTPDANAVKPEEWQSFSNSLSALLDDLKGDIGTFAFKAGFGT